MGKVLIDGDLPARWAVEGTLSRSGASDGASVRIGNKRIALSDIVAVTGSTTRERPIAGLVMSAGLFFVSASLIAFLVLDLDWRLRYLIASFFLAFLAIAGFTEATKAKALDFFEVTLATRTRGEVRFASTDAREIEEFLTALKGAGIAV